MIDFILAVLIVLLAWQSYRDRVAYLILQRRIEVIRSTMVSYLHEYRVQNAHLHDRINNLDVKSHREHSPIKLRDL